MHMSRCEGLAGQVCYPVTELIVKRRDKGSDTYVDNHNVLIVIIDKLQ